MAATTEGNRKIAAGLKVRWGVDKKGKSKFHQRMGAKGGMAVKESYFSMLKRTDPEKLKQIASKGAKASHETDTDQT